MKLVIVTGSSRGLGLEISSNLIKNGYKVVGISRHNSESFAALEQKGAVFFSYDFENTKDIHSLIKQITSSHGNIYGLINNAAIGKDGILATMHESDIEKTIKINIQSPILLSKYAIRSMLLKNEGRIINISSIIASTGFNGLSVYGASKASMQGFSKSLAREIGKANITVNSISPGFMQTDMSVGINEENMAKIKRRSPLKRLANTKDVADMVEFLLSQKGQNITGANFTIDAGSTA